MKQTKDRVAEIEVSYRPAIGTKPVIVTALDAYAELIEHFPPETIALQERFVALYMNRANRALGIYTISTGGITGTIVDVRLLLSVALKIAATSIILAHNHPSGNLQPSRCDIDITAKIKHACSYFDLDLRDHLIIAPGRQYCSMGREGLM